MSYVKDNFSRLFLTPFYSPPDEVCWHFCWHFLAVVDRRSKFSSGENRSHGSARKAENCQESFYFCSIFSGIVSAMIAATGHYQPDNRHGQCDENQNGNTQHHITGMRHQLPRHRHKAGNHSANLNSSPPLHFLKIELLVRR